MHDGRGVRAGMMVCEEVDGGEEVGVQAEGGKKRKMGKGRFGSGSSSARGISPARLLDRPPSSVTWDRM